MPPNRLPIAHVQWTPVTETWKRDPDLLDVDIWGTALAGRLASIKSAPRPISKEGAVVLTGDARLAAFAFHGMLNAVHRYSTSHPAVGLPLPGPEFSHLLKRSIALRDAAAHWDDKLIRGGSNTSLSVKLDSGLVVIAPPFKEGTDTVETAVQWDEMDSAAAKSLEWARRLAGE